MLRYWCESVGLLYNFVEKALFLLKLRRPGKAFPGLTTFIELLCLGVCNIYMYITAEAHVKRFDQH